MVRTPTLSPNERRPAMAMQNTGTPTVGTKVFTSDGEELGAVKEVAGDCFKLDVRMRPDYWLAVDAIESSESGGVMLRYTKESLDEAKVDGPGHTGYHSHDGENIV